MVNGRRQPAGLYLKTSRLTPAVHH